MPHNLKILIQEPYLNILRKEHVPVAVYLVNGIKLLGEIESFDNMVILLRNNQQSGNETREDYGEHHQGGRSRQLIYKHAISTIQPLRPVSFGVDSSARNDYHASKSGTPGRNENYEAPG